MPVGEDQKQHLELTRDIAQKFNNDFRRAGFLPAARARDHGPGDARDEPARRHEEDVEVRRPSDYSRINLTDDADAIAQKIRKAKTDPEPLPETDEELKDRPEADNLINIYAALADESRDAVIAQFAGQQFSGFKNALADLAVAKLTPIAAEMRRLMPDPAEIDRILKPQARRRPARIAAPVDARREEARGLRRLGPHYLLQQPSVPLSCISCRSFAPVLCICFHSALV